MNKAQCYKVVVCSFIALSVIACEKVAVSPEAEPTEELVSSREIALLLGGTSLETEQVREVFDAVSASIDNGYDEEYTMRNIFTSPGSGVGEEYLSESKSASKGYTHPLRDIFASYFSTPSKAGGTITSQEYIDYLSNCDLQLYWPYSEDWDGKTMPVITYAPENGSDTNTGWYMNEEGELVQVQVNEALARQRPVWIVNTNEDAGYTTLDVYKKNHPGWDEGGNITIGSKAEFGQKRSATNVKTLIIKDFTAKRNYDSWWAGASEFWVKVGAVEDFTASTEAELLLYSPKITDFIVVVKRRQVGQALQLNTVLVSEWTSQLQNCALMIVEDDGGTTTSWNCSAVVKYNSKSYGFEISIPYKNRDDIVWRGQLSRKYIESNTDVSGHFGDVIATFSIQ